MPHHRKRAGARRAGGPDAPPASWLRIVGDRPTPPLPGVLAAAAAILVAGSLRWAIVPYVGDASFIAAVPAVLLVTLLAGRWAGLTALLLGSALDIYFSTAVGGRELADALPRFLIWLTSAAVVMFLSLELRATLLKLRARERELLQKSDQLKLVNRELEHRGRNALAVIQALSNQIARSAGSVQAYRDGLAGKLSALSVSYASLTAINPGPEDLVRLVRGVLEPFGDQVVLAGGPPCQVPPQASLSLTLALHELATNACKYGGLSRPGGRVEVSWRVERDGLLDLAWRESGAGQPAAVPGEGFGSQLLRTAICRMAGGSFEVERRPEGMFIRIRFLVAPKAQAAA